MVDDSKNNDLTAKMLAVIELFTRACESFAHSLSRTDDVADEVAFTGAIHEVGFAAGRVHALGEALTLLSGSPEWSRQAEEVLAEYMSGTTLPEDDA